MKKVGFYSKPLDDPHGLVKDNSNATTKTADQPPKTPWYLRFTESFDPRGFAQVAGVGTLYGLLFASLFLAPLLRMESQPYGGTGTMISPADCSPPPSLSFPWLDDLGWSENAKEDLFCALWNGEAVTFMITIEFPAYAFSDSVSGGNAVGYYLVEVASWDDLVNAGSKLNDLKIALAFFEKKAKRAKLQWDMCAAGCLITWEAGALACLKFVNPKAILVCEGLAAAALITCGLACKSTWIGKIGDLRDDLEEKIIALTN